MVRHKVFGMLPQVSKQPQLLSHLIRELMSFDVSLRDDWNYDGGNAVEGWKGLTWEVLVKKEWFGRWLDVEKNCKGQGVVRSSRLMSVQLLFLDISTLSMRQTAARSIMTASIKAQPSLSSLLLE